MCLEKKESKNSHRNMAMQPQLGNSRKSSRPLLKVPSDLGLRDAKKNLKRWRAVALKIGQTRGRLLLLDVEQDSKLRAMIISLRTAEAGINQHVVRGVSVGLVQSYLEKLDKYVNFEVTRSWVRSLYLRMKFSRRAATTSIPVITRSLRNKIKSQFLHAMSQKVFLLSIPDELITNAD